MTSSSERMGILIDTTKCMGCRGCQVACKQWQGLKAEKTTFFGGAGYQNPPALSADTFTLITFTETEDEDGLHWTFAKRGCMHCDEPACASVCPVGSLHKTANGAVVYDADKCIGCRYCMMACPWSVPSYQWDSPVPFVRKCTMCNDRQQVGKAPACVGGCPTGALQFGRREDLLNEARTRIAKNPDRYVDHIYGEKEAGGTGVIYLSAIPFAELGFPEVPHHKMSQDAERVMKVLPWWVAGLGVVLTGTYALSERRQRIAAEHAAESSPAPQAGGTL
ncbi:MAG: 4Fe-4S dicluster domain-containing protein [Candidatus Competibacteraceae bacterium]